MIPRLFQISFLFLFTLLTGCEATSITIESTSPPLEVQHQLEQDWLIEFDAGNYTIENPYLLKDPYQNSPLSYLLMFKTEEEAIVSYEVVGHTPQLSFTYTSPTPTKEHFLILTGLYANEMNTIHLQATLETGEVLTHTLHLKTDPLPSQAIHPKVTQFKTNSEQTKLYLVSDDHYHYLIDEAGDIRWIQKASSGSVTPLKDGTLLTYDVPAFYYYHQALIERNYLGQILKQMYIPGAGHHSLVETDGGNYLINSSDKSNKRYIEDIIYLLDSNTGDVLETINLRDYLDVSRFEQTLPQAIKGDYNDWFHLNYAMMDSSDQSVIASGRSQSMVVKINPEKKEIKWILGAPDEVNESLQPYLLTPVNEPFSWPFAQHSAKVLPDLDQNPETTDLILFDNHVDIGVFPRKLYPDLNQYSRAVHYRIHESDLTIEQLWSFGEELNPPLFSSIISEVDYLPMNESMLVLFGFIQQGNQTGGKLFEVDAHDASSIVFEMELLAEGINHIYTSEALDMNDLNLTIEFTPISSLSSVNLNVQKETPLLPESFTKKRLDSSLIQTMTLTDSVLFFDAYLMKEQITDELTLVLTNVNEERYTYSISPTDCFLVTMDDSVPRLPSSYKRALKKGNLYRVIDRTDLSLLPSDTYTVSFFTNQTLYETSYKLHLQH